HVPVVLIEHPVQSGPVLVRGQVVRSDVAQDLNAIQKVGPHRPYVRADRRLMHALEREDLMDESKVRRRQAIETRLEIGARSDPWIKLWSRPYEAGPIEDGRWNPERLDRTE